MNGPKAQTAHAPQTAETFEDIFKTWYPAIVHYLHTLVQHRETAEDLAQEVFLRLYRTGVGQVHNLKAWLYTTASHTAYNYFRAEKSRQRREEEQQLEAHRQNSSDAG
jgi:RNA polymerase sigma factor (sigma-70 family)